MTQLKVHDAHDVEALARLATHHIEFAVSLFDEQITAI